MKRVFAALLFTALSSVAAVAQFGQLPGPSVPRLESPDLTRPLARPKGEARVLTRGVLAPAEADRLKYADFLSQSDTGLVRLLPRQVNNSKFFRPSGVKMNGGGAYYSFAYLSHEYGYGSDLELGTALVFYNANEQPSRHHFHVGFAGADFGLLTNIGDVPIESVARTDANVAFMLNYKTPSADERARCEHRMLTVGLQFDGQTYSNSAEIEPDSTYLLRSINYERSDLLVAFRVVRQDPDDSVTIAWKLLKKFSVPTLKRNKPDPNFKCPIR